MVGPNGDECLRLNVNRAPGTNRLLSIHCLIAPYSGQGLADLPPPKNYRPSSNRPNSEGEQRASHRCGQRTMRAGWVVIPIGRNLLHRMGNTRETGVGWSYHGAPISYRTGTAFRGGVVTISLGPGGHHEGPEIATGSEGLAP